MMRHLLRLVLNLLVSCLTCSCASSWPQDMPPTRYTGAVVNRSLDGQPVPGATVIAQRRSGRGIGLFSPETLASTTADPQGRFVLLTQSGYAQELRASSPDHRLIGIISAPHRSADNIIIKAEPQLYVSSYHRGVDPSSARVRLADAAVRQLIGYLSAHPEEPRQSLRGYAKRGVISDEQLASFTQAPDLFFGPTPQVDYVWGTQALSFPDVDAPMGFRDAPAPDNPFPRPRA